MAKDLSIGHQYSSFEENTRTRLVNISALLAFVSCVIYVTISYRLSLWLFAFSFLCLLSFAVTIYLNRLRKLFTAKVLLFGVSYTYLFLSAAMYGKESGIHFLFVPVLLSAILAFSVREKWLFLTFTLMSLIAIFTLEWINYAKPILFIPPSLTALLYYINLSTTVIATAIIAIVQFFLYSQQIDQSNRMLQMHRDIEKTIDYFSNSTFGKNSLNEILWDVAKNCIGQLGLVDCVIYLVDEDRKELVQRAAYGLKNPNAFEIHNPLEIPIGEGIVGHVALSGKPLLIHDTSKDTRYIADDQRRMSELAIPIINNQKVIGVIDSEHPEKNFFNEHHLNVMKIISSLCSIKIARTLAEEERERSLRLKLEAEKIQALDEWKSKLYGDVSHELRTPLTLMTGTIDQQLKNMDSPEWRVMKKSTDRLLKLIHQFQELATLEVGQYRINPREMEVMNFIRMTLSVFDLLANQKKVTLSVTCAPEEQWLLLDPNALEIILMNLVSNAVKFTPKGGTVTIDVRYDEGLTVMVTDTGIGIAPEDKENIFLRYYQVSPGDQEGSGIGLSLVKDLVEIQQGQIHMQSELNHGAAFTVNLPYPMADPPDTFESPLHAEEMWDDEQLPLLTIVEDNQDLLNYLSQALSGEFRLRLATDGRQAIKKIQEDIPDLVVSDIMMPAMSGMELCRQLKEDEVTNHIPIILLSAKTDMASKLRGLQWGADDYLVKPFNQEELLARVRNLLRQRDLMKAKYQKIIEVKPSNVVITSNQEIFITTFMRLIDEHMDDLDFDVHGASEAMNMSRMQLHRKIKAITGKSTMQFIKEYRLNQAAKLLAGDERISQICYAVGFSNLSQFTTAFKELYGLPPSEYRSQLSLGKVP